MGSPTIFSGKYTKLLTQKGLMQQGGAVNQFDGVRNYIKNSTFEANILDGWNRVKTTITSNLPTGTPTIGQSLATAPSIASFYVNGGSAPFDSYALYFGNPITTVVAGEGIISDAFTVESGDLGKVLTFKLYYKSEYGASTDNWSGVLGSQTWAVYIYDQTAGAWLQPAGFLGMNQNSGVGLVSGTFQSSVVAGQQYRIAVIALKNTTSTSALQIDNISVSSQTAPIGPVVTDWVSYTPTVTHSSGGITNATHSARWCRVGDSIKIRITTTFTAASAAFVNMIYALPSGLSFDLTKFSGTLETNLGISRYLDAGVLMYTVGGTCLVSANTFRPTYANSLGATSPVQGANVTNSLPFTFNINDTIETEIMAPISGWSSNVQLSNDTDTRVVDFRAYTTSARTVNNTAPTIVFENVDKDSHGAYNSSTGVYTVPVSGDYVVSGQMRIGGVTMTAGAFFGFSASVDNAYSVRNHYTAFRAVTNSSAGNYAEGSGSVLLPNLSAGQTIRVKGWADVASSTFTDGANTFCIQRISGPSVVAASETVAAEYASSAGNIITNLVNPMFIDFGTKQGDTHNAVVGAGSGNNSVASNTWRFVAPVSGRYQVNAVVAITLPAGINIDSICSIAVNGTVVQVGPRILYNAWGSAFNNVIVSGEVKVNAGDYISIGVYQNSGANRAMEAGATSNRVSIYRVGN